MIIKAQKTKSGKNATAAAASSAYIFNSGKKSQPTDHRRFNIRKTHDGRRWIFCAIRW